MINLGGGKSNSNNSISLDDDNEEFIKENTSLLGGN